MYIVATISKNSFDKVEEIIKAGATVLRYNFAHGTPEEMKMKIEKGRLAIKNAGMEGKIKIMADLPGAKIRMGRFEPREITISKGDEIIFKSAQESENYKNFIPVNADNLGKLTKIGDIFTIADGHLAFQTSQIIGNGEIKAKALNSGILENMKGINFGDAMDERNHLTQQTLEHIKFLKENINPDRVAFSFVNSKEYLEKGKKLLKENGLDDVKIVSKIETRNGVKNIDEIAQNCDVLLVARGDLGLCVPYYELGILQKEIIKAGKKHSKDIVVSTQILESILNSFVPNRSDILDLTNIVLDGADGIMLARETGISQTPGYSVKVAQTIIDYVKKSFNI